MADERSAHWNGIYSTKSDRDVSWFEDQATTSLALVRAAGAAAEAGIVDIGAGTSRFVDGLLAQGYKDITLVDISRAALDATRLRLGGPGRKVRTVVADVTTWRPDRTFGVWHDRAVLHFLTGEDERAAYRTSLLSATATGSQAIIATFAPTGPETCSGLPVRRYGREDLQAFLGDDFEIVQSFEQDHRTPWGALQRFHVARAVRA